MRIPLLLPSFFALISLVLPVSTQAQYNPIERVSVDDGGDEVPAGGTNGSMQSSANGRYIVFSSDSDELVNSDSNGVTDIFLYDRDNDTIVRVSIDSDENEANGASTNPTISADGLFVAFESVATDLVSGDSNNRRDIFVRSIAAGTTERVSIDSDEGQSDGDSFRPSISSDGQFVAFDSEATDLVSGDSNGLSDVFLRDRTAETTVRVSVADDEDQGTGSSSHPSINGDGDLVAFQSDADEFVSGDGNSATDIFVRDTGAETTTLVSKNDDGNEGNFSSTKPSISADGKVVVFQSSASNLVSTDNDSVQDIFAFTIATETTEKISVDSTEDGVDGLSRNARPSSDGMLVVFESNATNLVDSDDNGVTDIFVRDRSAGTTVRISVGSTNTEATAASLHGSINSNGQFIAFQSTDSEFVSSDDNGMSDVFVVNTQCLLTITGITELDTDSDGTDDCDDACPTDEDKTAGGDCGCGKAETDSDSDGTADCLDSCPSDGDKITGGSCGCGTADTDSDGNGVADCLDPTSETIPQAPIVKYRKRSRILRARVPNEFPGSQYRWTVRRNGQRLRRRTTSTSRVRFRNLRGQVAVRYRLLLSGGGRSKISGASRVKTG